MKAYVRILSFLLLLAAFPAQAGFDGNGNCTRSSGVFTGANVWVNTRDAARAIRADDMDTHDNGIVDCIENTVTLDGQNTPTANLPMGGFKHTGVGDAAASDQYVAAGQIQDGDLTELTSVAGTDTITASASPAISAYTAGQIFHFVAAGTNTGAATLNVNSVGAKAVQKLGAALVAGDITAADGVLVQYDGTQFQMLSPARTPVLTAGSIDATDLATDSVAAAEIAAGAVDTAELAANAVTLAKLEDSAGTAGQVYTLDSAGTAGEWADKLTSDTEVSATSGTSVPFTSIPSWVKRITVQFFGVSTNGTDDILIQIGDSGGLEITGYTGGGGSFTTATQSATASTAGFLILTTDGSDSISGAVTLTLQDASNSWVAAGVLFESVTSAVRQVAGAKALSATLDRVTVTTTGGTNTFDTGSINILYQ